MQVLNLEHRLLLVAKERVGNIYISKSKKNENITVRKSKKGQLCKSRVLKCFVVFF